MKDMSEEKDELFQIIDRILEGELCSVDAHLELLHWRDKSASQRLSHLMDVAKSLADWSRKYPKDTVHSATYEAKCNDELYAIEEKAKALIAEWDGIKDGGK